METHLETSGATTGGGSGPQFENPRRWTSVQGVGERPARSQPLKEDGEPSKILVPI